MLNVASNQPTRHGVGVARSWHLRREENQRKMKQHLAAINAVLGWLAVEGHEPIAFYASEGTVASVQLAESPRLRRILDEGGAVVAGRGVGVDGEWRAIELIDSPAGVRVTWVERVAPVATGAAAGGRAAS